MKRLRWDPWLMGILAVGAVLMLANLGNGRLWQDEAETAVLGRNILHFGYPCAFDGVNLVNPTLPTQGNYAWTYHSWLPIYLAAGSFSLLGVNTVSARLPFALLGLASLWIGYRLFRRITGELLTARLATLMLATSVPFLLHMRQCRYYAPAVFFTLWAVLAYWRFSRGRRFSGAELVVALNLLFHADHGVFIPVAAGLGLHFLWSRPRPADWHRAGAVAILVLALTLPWMIYLQSWQHHRVFSFKEVSHQIQFYFRQINRFILPAIFWGITWLLWRRSFKDLSGAVGSPRRQAWKLVGSLLLTGILFLIFVPEQRHFRYLLFLIPWLFLIQAALLARLFQSRRAALMAGLTAVLLLTDLFHYSAPQLLAPLDKRLYLTGRPPRSLLVEFLGELTHPYRGPIDGIVELLLKEGKPGDSVKISYGDIPLIFYLPDRKIEPFFSSERFAEKTTPDWIILRKDWLPDGFLESPYYRKIQEGYRKILLDAPDIPWQNRPDPGYHRFRTDVQAPPVVVFQKER